MPGEPREVDGEWGETRSELVGGDRPEEMVVSDLEDEQITRSSTWRAIAAVVVGAIAALIGLPVLLAFLGLTLAGLLSGASSLFGVA